MNRKINEVYKQKYTPIFTIELFVQIKHIPYSCTKIIFNISYTIFRNKIVFNISYNISYNKIF